MKRIDRVYKFVEDQTKELEPSELTKHSGVTTLEVSDALCIQRTNASKDLNTLVREGVIDKIDGRPVRYVSKSIFKHQPFSKYVKSYQEDVKIDQSKVPIISLSSDKFMYSDDIFKRIIGINGSMKNVIEQAKAAILYPPKGLNSLIIGPTGSGKTYFAHTMYQFAKQNNVINDNKELIVFNCADYANNPELLMSHLFGHVAGAYTGADQEKDGLISLAHNSFLFLDEIHRLPPEGQEMIFYFMDNGKFAKLGESKKEHSANVRIICATTEDPSSALLNTFMRRIPITIQLPSFKDRSPKEKVDLVCTMMSIEAKRIQRRIVLTDDVIKALIGSVSYGNVGQLKSNVQLVTAQAFLKQMDKGELHIMLDELNDSIKNGLIHLASDRQNLSELTALLEPKVTISPNEPLSIYEEDSYELPYNLYDIIGDKATLLKEDGFNQDAINHFITTDINIHLKSFYRDHGFTFDTETKLAEIIDRKVIETTRQIYDYAVDQLNYNFQSNFLYAMGLHISSFLNRYNRGEDIKAEENENIVRMISHYPKERELALVFKSYIEKNHHVILPESEVNYLTVLLVSLKETQKDGRIGIVVAAHGMSTASSMAQVAMQLLEVDNIRAVDMPLDMSPREALEKVIENVEDVSEGSGVLLLVDMGSLITFSDEIIERTTIEIKVVDMLTTSLVLEAARKSNLLDTKINDLHDYLLDFHGYRSELVLKKEEKPIKPHSKKAIIAICASGKGTAQRMKELINNYLTQYVEEDIEVLTASIVDLDEKVRSIEENYQILASTGIKKPNITVPFISMDQLFSPDGPLIISDIISHHYRQPDELDLSEHEAKKICQTYLNDHYTFINSNKIIDLLWSTCEYLVTEFLIKTDYTFYINTSMHLAGMIERCLLNNELTIDLDELEELNNSPYTKKVNDCLSGIMEELNIEFLESEVYYLNKIIENQLIR